MHYSRWQRTGDPLTTRQRKYAGVDFDQLVDRSAGESGCWPWMGEIDKQGYGRWRRDGVDGRAHREAFARAGNDLPPLSSGLVLDHTCHDPRTCAGGPTCPHRRCCNPAHLALVPNLVNLLSPERTRGTRGKVKERCKREHPLGGANLYVSPQGVRCCRECRRIWKHEHRRAKT